jgi:hypothetical protein
MISTIIRINKTYWVNIWEALTEKVGPKRWDPSNEVSRYDSASSKVRD